MFTDARWKSFLLGCTASIPFVSLDASAQLALEEIVVTAERRESSLQETAVAVSAFTDVAFDRLQATNIIDLHLKAPNVTIVNNVTTANSAQIFIRGIGRDDATWNVESGVALYVDGVVIPQQNGALLDLVELERVEVLRGPQGTLYGRNATGGAVKFITKKPEFTDLSFVGDVTFGSYNRFDVKGAVGTQLVEDELAVRLDFVSRTEEGYIEDFDSSEKYNATDRQAAKLTALWQVSDTVEVSTSLDYSRDDSGISTPTPIRLGFTAIDPDGDGFQDPAYGDTLVANPSINDVSSFEGYGAATTFKWDSDIGTITSVTSYRDYTYDQEGDLDGQPLTLLDFAQFIDSRTFFEDVQLSTSLSDSVSLVAGAYFLDDKVSTLSDNNFVAGGTRAITNQKTTSLAGYAETTWDVTDWVSLTAGGRFTYDKKTADLSGQPIGGGPETFATTLEDSWTEFTPRFVVEFKPIENVLVYAQYSEGFKAGGVSDGRPGSATSAVLFEPELAESIELGFKSDFLDDRVRFNAAYFSTKNTGLASTFLNATTNTIQVATSDVDIEGFEAEVTALLFEGFTLYGTVGILDGQYSSLPVDNTGTVVGGVTFDNKLKHVPEWHFSIGAEYTWQAPSLGGSIGIGANLTSSDSIFRNVANDIQALSPAFDLVDARLFYASDDDRWTVTLAGKNLTDEEYWTQAISTFGRYYTKPATWSLSVRTRF